MKKMLEIDYYFDGYNVSHLNCIDIPIAGASGYYNIDNYYLYCFYYVYLNNWMDVNSYSFLEFRNIILNKMGLSLEAYNIDSTHDFFSKVKYLIDNNQPVILLVDYRALFYCDAYEEGAGGTHAIIICGYNSEKSLFYIRDFVHIEEAKIRTIVRADALYRLRLTERQLLDILEKSNLIFCKERNIHFNKLYSLKKTNKPTISNYNDLIADIISNNERRNNLAVVVGKFNENISNSFFTDQKLENYRRIFYRGMIIFFEVIEKSLRFTLLNSIYKEKMESFKTDYCKFRDEVISLICANTYRKKFFDDDKRKKIIDKISVMDNNLFELLKTFYQVEIKSKSKILYLSLDKYFNNKGFGNSVSNKSNSFISKSFYNDRFYFLANGFPRNYILKVDDMKFRLAQLDREEGYDNISCEGQLIKVPVGKYGCIMLLGCSISDSFSDKIDIIYENGENISIDIGFTRCDLEPTFGEKVAWKGQAVIIENDIANVVSFKPQLFAKYYPIDTKPISYIRLPNQPKIHIFAISLFQS